MQIQDLTIDELRALIRETVQEAIQAAIVEFLPDPDANLPVKPEFEQSLLEIRQRRATKATSIPAAEVAHRLGIQSE